MAALRSSIVVFALVAFLVAVVSADIYLHNPAGSNNKLNEQANNANNQNRLFNSQNNDGGYQTRRLYYYVGSTIPIEFTAQHSCGEKSKCEIIIQYSCDDNMPGLRDGSTTNTIPDNVNRSRDIEFGQHETFSYYQACKVRQRNRGLLTLDQNLGGNQAIFTRQNPNGNRRGFECPEERDYYPYWHPTPWIDIAVMTSDTSRCDYYRAESQNVKDKASCSLAQFNNERDCTTANGRWFQSGSFMVDPPQCVPACWSRDNHLGNTKGAGEGGDPQPCQFQWTVPNHISEACVLRLRYNISTAEYDGWTADSTYNTNTNTPNKIIARRFTAGPVYLTQNPTITYAGVNLKMAVNTNQYGRTFQDRTHVFAIRPRPEGIEADAKIVNLNVRGRRGNIVQVFPSVEYDFIPNRLGVTDKDYVHFQWSGSNRNPQNNDGRGLAGTDRSNFVQMASLTSNYPLPWANQTFFADYFNFRHFALLNAPQMGGDTQNLDDAGTYFDGGLARFSEPGSVIYKSTRNDNFSNRSQKGVINVSLANAGLSAGAIAAIVVGTTAVSATVGGVVTAKVAPAKFALIKVAVTKFFGFGGLAV